MLFTVLKAFQQLWDSKTQLLVLLCGFITVFLFASLWFLIALILNDISYYGVSWLKWIADFAGDTIAIALTWFFFPTVISVVICFFLDRVADNVDARYYSWLPPPKARPVPETTVQTIKFFILIFAVNFLLLPFLLFMPLFLFVFYAANGYFVGREYFELVAQRRLPPVKMHLMRKKKRLPITTVGVFFSFLMTCPLSIY